MASIPSILTEINNANVTPTGEVQWPGTGGLQQITTEMTEVVRDRGMYTIPVDQDGNVDFTTLGMLGPADTRQVFLQKFGYFWYSPVSQGETVEISANGMGWWILWSMAVRAPYQSQLTSGSTVYNVTHNLGTITPAVRLYYYPAVGSLPLTVDTRPVITIDGPDTLIVTYSVAPTTNVIIIVQP